SRHSASTGSSPRRPNAWCTTPGTACSSGTSPYTRTSRPPSRGAPGSCARRTPSPRPTIRRSAPPTRRRCRLAPATGPRAAWPASDVYAVAALVYYVLTGHEPDADPARIVPPRQLRPAVPAALERVLLRALQAAPAIRYYTATEMLEDFVSDAGVFQEPAATPPLAEAGFERRLRRALGDDYELLEEIGTGGFGRVYRARDLGLERDVAIKVLHPSLTADAAVTERFRREAQ